MCSHRLVAGPQEAVGWQSRQCRAHQSHVMVVIDRRLWMMQASIYTTGAAAHTQALQGCRGMAWDCGLAKKLLAQSSPKSLTG